MASRLTTRIAALAAALCVSTAIPALAQEPPPTQESPSPSATPSPSPAPTPAPPEPTPAPPPSFRPEPTAAPPATRSDQAVRAVSGLGMYVWQWDRTGTPAEVVAKARASNMSFIIVRASSASAGFYLAPLLRDLLPLAHAAGLKVVAYDPPRFENVEADVRRAHEVMSFRVRGHAIDAFAADIEPKWELLTPQAADRYGALLRQAAGPSMPLVAVVHPPNLVGNRFPFAAVARHFDVLSPMGYWRARTLESAAFTAESVRALRAYGRPVTAIGQAFSYDTHPQARLRGHPGPAELKAAIDAARAAGAVGMSFWVWEHAEPWVFDVIRDARWLGSAGPGLGVRPPKPAKAPPAAPVVVSAAPQMTASPEAVEVQAAAVWLEPPLPAAPPAPSGQLPAAAAMALLVAAGAVVLHTGDWSFGGIAGLASAALVAVERSAAPLVANSGPGPDSQAPGAGESDLTGREPRRRVRRSTRR
ncbi:MAG TPA: hypothetical protein VNE62_08770 [Actinomycetota bacterium]|nr:hypothetical protein [Actinomycetota bacterium]